MVANNNSTFNASINGVYYVEAVDPQSNCISTKREAVELNIYPEYNPIIASDGDSLHTSIYSSYQWYKDGIAIFGANAKSQKIQGIGIYYVEVVDSNGCIRTSNEVNIKSTAGIDSDSPYHLFELYPNPFSEYFKLDLNPRLVNSEIRIINIYGETVLAFNASSNSSKINTSDLASGVYFVELTHEGKEVVKKIVKH